MTIEEKKGGKCDGISKLRVIKLRRYALLGEVDHLHHSPSPPNKVWGPGRLTYPSGWMPALLLYRRIIITTAASS